VYLNNIKIIEETDLDIILYETIPCLREIKVLSKVLSQTNKEIWISITCNENIEFRDGSSFKEACKIISPIEQITTLCLSIFLIFLRLFQLIKEKNNLFPKL
jgi:S-methylmethionine-dependent homocysteine/selenocysteine methylase